MSETDEWTPAFRLEIGTNDEDQVVVTIEKKTDGDWMGIGTVYEDTLTDALIGSRMVIDAHTE